MSRAEGADRLLDAAVALGSGQGVSALSIGAIATAAGVSKALVLYHHADKPQLLRALHAHLGAASASRIRAAAAQLDPADPIECWRELARAEAARGELALLSALRLEGAVRDAPATPRDAVATIERARETAATELVAAMLNALDLTPRVDPSLIGRMLLRHLDGLASTSAAGGVAAHSADSADASGRSRAADADLNAELDTFALALLGLGS